MNIDEVIRLAFVATIVLLVVIGIGCGLIKTKIVKGNGGPDQKVADRIVGTVRAVDYLSKNIEVPSALLATIGVSDRMLSDIKELAAKVEGEDIIPASCNIFLKINTRLLMIADGNLTSNELFESMDTLVPEHYKGLVPIIQLIFLNNIQSLEIDYTTDQQKWLDSALFITSEAVKGLK